MGDVWERVVRETLRGDVIYYQAKGPNARADLGPDGAEEMSSMVL